MSDNLTKKQRSFCRSKIRGRNTAPELKPRAKNIHLEYHPKNIFENPDFIDRENNVVMFTDGCFWHKYSIHYKAPRTPKKYWLPKLEKNTIRDAKINLTYKNAGGKVKRIWEHELN
jgi:DNA mismatch endonuclease (patch repair protein)